MYTVTTANELTELGHNVTLLCYPDSKIYGKATKAGLNVKTVKAEGYFHPFKILKLGGFLKKENFDVIHTHASKDLWLIVPALEIYGLKTPLFFTKHVGSFIRKKDLLHKFLYNRINTAFAISSIIKRNLVETTPLTEDKIEILYNGIDTEKLNPENAGGKKIREEFGIGEQEILTGMIARFTWGKGHEEFLEAANNLIQKYSNLKFIIVGEASRGEQNYERKIKNLADELNLTDKVIFTGYREDIPRLLAAMDIFVFPSHSEAFGIALIEAMAMGVPSVCSDSNGILDIAVDGETSLLFKTKDAPDLSRKLEQLIRSPELRKTFGKAAIKRAREKFEIKKLISNLIDFYKKSLNPRNVKK